MELPDADAVARRYGIEIDTTGEAPAEWTDIEWVVHELAHWVTLGLRGDSRSVSEDVTATCHEIGSAAADENEAETLAVEFAALMRLGAPVRRFRRGVIDYASQQVSGRAMTDKERGANSNRIVALVKWFTRRVRHYESLPSTRKHAEKVLKMLRATTRETRR